MAQHEEIIVWLDRRWKEAIEHHLKDETLSGSAEGSVQLPHHLL